MGKRIDKGGPNSVFLVNRKIFDSEEDTVYPEERPVKVNSYPEVIEKRVSKNVSVVNIVGLNLLSGIWKKVDVPKASLVVRNIDIIPNSPA